MAELSPKERLQPSLLDRLRDDDPESREESREKRVLSLRQLRESVTRDLSWLLNTSRLDQLEDLNAFPAVQRSVLNYGSPSLAGTSCVGADLMTIQREVKQAILDFEPRLLPDTVKVTVSVDETVMSKNAMFFQIEAELWAQPMPINLFLKTEVDLENGNVRVVQS